MIFFICSIKWRLKNSKKFILKVEDVKTNDVIMSREQFLNFHLYNLKINGLYSPLFLNLPLVCQNELLEKLCYENQLDLCLSNVKFHPTILNYYHTRHRRQLDLQHNEQVFLPNQFRSMVQQVFFKPKRFIKL